MWKQPNTKQRVLIGAALLLALTNPSQSDFQEKYAQFGKRKLNFLLFSVWEGHRSEHYDGPYYRLTYIGILKNFVEVKEERK